MSWSRALPAAAACLLLAACGFTPLYGGAAQGRKFDSVAVASIADRSGQMLRNDLLDLIYTGGEPENPAYTLEVSGLTETVTSLDITITSNTTRQQMRLTATMILKDRASGKVLMQRDLTSSGSYDVLSSIYTTQVSAENVRADALEDMARQIQTQLALYFNGN